MNQSILPVPSHNIDAEIAVLGCGVLFPETVPRTLDVLKPHHFYTKVHQDIYHALLNLTEKGKTIDLITVCQELDNVEARSVVSSLMDFKGSSVGIEEYRNILKACYAKRQLNKLLTAAIDCMETSSLERAIDTLNKGIELINHETGVSKELKTPQEVGDEFIDDFTRRMKGEITFHRLGIKTLDHLIGPIESGDLVVVGARPGTGKTTFALNIMSNNAVENVPCLLWSCEMSEQKLRRKMVARETKINSMVLKKGSITNDADVEMIVNANNEINKLPMHVIYDTDFDYNNISRFIDIIKPKIVIFDFLQQFTLKQSFITQSEASAIAQIVKDIKRIAIKKNIVCVVLSQVKREVDQRGDDNMFLSDFHGSGGIEAKADIALLLSQSLRSVHGQAGPVPCTKFTLAKNRDGGTGEAYMMFDSQHSNFEEIKE